MEESEKKEILETYKWIKIKKYRTIVHYPGKKDIDY